MLQKLARVFKEKAQQDVDRIFKGTSKTREKLGVRRPRCSQAAAQRASCVHTFAWCNWKLWLGIRYCINLLWPLAVPHAGY